MSLRTFNYVVVYPDTNTCTGIAAGKNKKNVQEVALAVYYTKKVTVPAGYFHSSSRPGMYSKLTSNTTGLLGGTLGLPGAEVRPFGNANCSPSRKRKPSSLPYPSLQELKRFSVRLLACLPSF